MSKTNSEHRVLIVEDNVIPSNDHLHNIAAQNNHELIVIEKPSIIPYIIMAPPIIHTIQTIFKDGTQNRRERRAHQRKNNKRRN